MKIYLDSLELLSCSNLRHTGLGYFGEEGWSGSTQSLAKTLINDADTFSRLPMSASLVLKDQQRTIPAFL